MNWTLKEFGILLTALVLVSLAWLGSHALQEAFARTARDKAQAEALTKEVGDAVCQKAGLDHFAWKPDRQGRQFHCVKDTGEMVLFEAPACVWDGREDTADFLARCDK